MTIEQQIASPRWRDYVLDYGKGLAEFWKSHLHDSKRQVLFVLGKGFDPRMYLGFEALINAGGDGRRDILAIDLEEGSRCYSHKP